ncbi:MAG: type II toxin-antitoxin system VapC family toxin [Terrimicrobiaceae bacterium]|jgi:predicted nucleic acid-binding protein|nr:type II toxin-antitoxin system VapC family toxin [Terrimicrobiaceae bacterium]
MTLDDIINGSTVFIDTNVLVYARRGQSVQCRQLLSRCNTLAVHGVISGFVVAEFCHRRMMQEAQATGRAPSNPARTLAQKPEMVRQLSVYAGDVRALLGGELALMEAGATDFAVALELQRQMGLLTIDSVNLAVARRLGINEIVTADSHFDHIQGLIVYKPDDLV